MRNQTITQHIVQKQQKATEENKKETQKVRIIKLEEKPRHRVSWTEDTIDNEGMNKKKSNLCCIYHRPGEESSDTCSSDDEGNALERDRHTKHLHKKKCSKLNKKKTQQNLKQQQKKLENQGKHT